MKTISLVTVGAVLATVAAYLWSLLFWQLLPFKIVTSPYDKGALVQFLETKFPQSGTYTLPAPDDNEEATKEFLEVGPVVTMHILGPRDISLRTRSFLTQIVLTFFTVFTLGWVLWMARPAIVSYRVRVLLAALIGLAAALYNDLADPVWTYHPLQWTLAKALYHITSWTVAGLVLGAGPFTGLGLVERRRRFFSQIRG